MPKELKAYVEGNTKYKHAKMNDGFDFTSVSRHLIPHSRKVSYSIAMSYSVLRLICCIAR